MGTNPDLFFPEGPPTDPYYQSQVQAAARICSTCPVSEPCRQAGLREKHGVWGGIDRRTELRDALA